MMPHQLAEQNHPGQSVLGGVGISPSVSMQQSVNSTRHRDPRRQEEVQVNNHYCMKNINYILFIFHFCINDF